jgi:hypothetical protein
MHSLIISLWTGPLRQVAVEATGDPFAQFSTLGIAGVACVAFYMAWRSSEKQRDRALDERNQATDALQKVIPILTELKISVDRATDAGNAQAEATKTLAEATKGMPDQQTWFRLLEVLQSRNPPRRAQ